jgi:hypothetical protein
MYANRISIKMFTGFTTMVLFATAILAGVATNRVYLTKAAHKENVPAQSKVAFTDKPGKRRHTITLTAAVLKEKGISTMLETNGT